MSDYTYINYLINNSQNEVVTNGQQRNSQKKSGKTLMSVPIFGTIATFVLRNLQVALPTCSFSVMQIKSKRDYVHN